MTVYSPTGNYPLPTDDELEVAMMWLESYEGEGADACRRAAAFLFKQKTERWLRYEARKFGVPVAAVRRKLKASGPD